jgi:hypothetical protein
VALPVSDPDEDETSGYSGRRFTVYETTSGLPDDSREADERAAARALRDLRSRVKAARAVVTTTPGLAEIVARDWQRAARFYARFGITETWFRNGVPLEPWDVEDLGLPLHRGL